MKRDIYKPFIKKAFSLFLSVAIFIMMLASAASADTTGGSLTGDADASAVTDINKMASALHELNILQGDNGDYMLDKQTKRSEAAAFIIRMLGKDSYVIQNAVQFKYTKYIDVVASKWYAPYIGYCTLANILAGTTASTFEPEEFTTEKQFLKMALCALGYEYNIDFDWSNVYQKAHAVGIVIDPSYINRTQDNTSYLRSDAVAVIYRSLNTPRKGMQVKMIEALVNEGTFTRELAAASGILGDDKPMEIDLVTALSPTSVEVNLNEKVSAVKQSDVAIYESSAPASILSVQSLAFMDDKIQIITSAQNPDKEYIISINNITDINGNHSGKLSSTFKGYVQQHVTSEHFKIMRVEQYATNVINIYFTHPVNENSETASYYDLTKNGSMYMAGSSQNFTVRRLPSVDNAVSIYMKNIILDPGQLYGVRIDGRLTSSYGVKLGEGYGESMDFVAKAAESGKLEVSSVQAWTSMSVRILFNNEIDHNWAEKRLNYTVTDKNGSIIDVTKAVVGGVSNVGGKEVMLSLASPLDTTRQYEVKIEFIPDIYMQSIIEEKTYTFSGVYPINSELDMKQAMSEYNNSVVLIFNKALDSISANNNVNYTINGISDAYFSVVPKKAYYSEKYGVYAVKLFLPEGFSFSNSQKYIVYANGIKDSLGTNYTSFFSKEFMGGGSSVVKPRIADAVTVSKNAVKLVFNTEIAFNVNNISTSNYSLEYIVNGEVFKTAPIGVTYVDPTTLVLRFDELDTSIPYQLRFDSITDYSEVYTRTASDGDNTTAIRFGR